MAGAAEGPLGQTVSRGLRTRGRPTVVGTATTKLARKWRLWLRACSFRTLGRRDRSVPRSCGEHRARQRGGRRLRARSSLPSCPRTGRSRVCRHAGEADVLEPHTVRRAPNGHDRPRASPARVVFDGRPGAGARTGRRGRPEGAGQPRAPRRGETLDALDTEERKGWARA